MFFSGGGLQLMYDARKSAKTGALLYCKARNERIPVSTVSWQVALQRQM